MNLQHKLDQAMKSAWMDLICSTLNIGCLLVAMYGMCSGRWDLVSAFICMIILNNQRPK
jgi:hypothetical protein